MMRELLNIDPKKATTGNNSVLSKTLKLSADISVDVSKIFLVVCYQQVIFHII